ncbi:MAG TPA: serine/threonine-protein kinase, partial [Herpetosiphonaceae bacterium]|nr:serine/threonine-protein kinase [Herpetosiphonaceae bacterium]
MDSLIGKRLGRYAVEELIARGRTAAVYRAVNAGTGDTVALKVLLPELAVTDTTLRQRFLREASIVRQLAHPHIVPVMDAGEQDGLLYIAMPFMVGGTVRDWLAESRVTVRDVVAVFSPVAGALDYAHERGIVHRDVKPTNILLSAEGQPFLSDFGIAQATSATRLTGTGVILGTTEYLSPEQVQGQPLTGRSDQYALGVVIYEALTGRCPFLLDGGLDGFLALAMRIATQPPPPPHTLNSSIGPAVEKALLRALAKHPDDRYPTCHDLVTALDSAR